MSKQNALMGIVLAMLIGALITLAGSQQSVSYNGLPIFMLCAGFAFLLQWLAFVPAYLNHTEVYYDLTGGLTYLAVILLAVGLPISQGQQLGQRTLIIAILCGLWALRLGNFLYQRIRKAGADSRFDQIKFNAFQFFMTWTIQGLWVVVTLGAGLAAMTTQNEVPLGVFAYIGMLMWFLGFLIEVVADKQKSRFRVSNAGGFIQSGLWSWSRHPNYFGEILLWLGIAFIAWPTLEGWRLVTLISPVFVFVLLVFVSGVRMLEASADLRWGDKEEYKAYVARTSVLIPLPPKSN